MKAVTFHGKRDVRVDSVPDPHDRNPTDDIIRVTGSAEADVRAWPVAVRYDPSDHSKVALDLPALKAKQTQSQAAEQRALDTQFENLGTPGAPGAGGGEVIAGLDDLGGLKAQVQAAAAQNAGSVIDLRSSSPDGSAPDPVERLAKLAALKQQGMLSDAQFEAAKAKVLGES